ncbi:MAG: hypothetical protein ABI308_02870 [Mucilaginibacter sp.]
MKYLFILLILLPALSFAQSNNKPGYIVTLQGDTIKGFITFKGWNTPDKIIFKNNADAVMQTYTPTKINGFGLKGGNTYQTYKGRISEDRMDLSSLSIGIDSTFSKDTVFLRVVKKGKNVTLLHYKDAIKDRFFIAEKNGPPTELIYRAYVSNIKNRTGLIETFDTKYQKQLHALRIKYRPDEAQLINAIQTAQYTEKDLVKIINKLN